MGANNFGNSWRRQFSLAKGSALVRNQYQEVKYIQNVVPIGFCQLQTSVYVFVYK